MPITRAILAAGLAAFTVGTAAAEDAPACESFAWSIARERSAFAAEDLRSLASGSALPDGAGAAQVALKPVSEITLPIPPERAAKPATFAGFVTASVPVAGAYQVTLSDEAWIDVRQAGRKALKPSAFSGKRGCPDVRKSLRFTLEAGPVTIQVSSVPVPQIKLDLITAE